MHRHRQGAVGGQIQNGLGEQLPHALGIGQGAQHRLGPLELPRAGVRPQVAVGNAFRGQQRERNVSHTLGARAQAGRFDHAVRNVERDVQHNADAHDHAPAGDGVDGGARHEPRHQREQAECQQGHRRQYGHRQAGLRHGSTVVQHVAGAPGQQHRKVDAQGTQVQHFVGQGAPVWRALPQQALALRQRLGQAGRSLELVFVLRCLAHINGSWRLGVAYSVPAP